MKRQEIDLMTQAYVQKACIKHLGFGPSAMDIIQKLGHLHSLLDPAPVDMVLLRQHVIRKVREFIQNNKGYYRSIVIKKEINRLKVCPSSPIPLP